MDTRAEVVTRFKRAMETHDVDALLATFSPDVVLRSPISARVVFRGLGELRELMEIHFAAVRDVRYQPDALVYTAVTCGQPVEVVNRLAFDTEGLIDEITVYVRPLPGLVALAAALGPPLASRRRSRAHGALLWLLLRPLALLLAAADRLAPRFA